MRTYNSFIKLGVAGILFATLTACGEDRPVHVYDTPQGDAGGSDTGGSTGTGGTSSTGGDSGTGTGGSDGGSTSGLPGSFMKGPMQLFSFSITASDAYDTFGFYATKDGELKSCAADTACMTKAKDNTAGRPFQFLVGNKNYDEGFGGQAKAFCVYMYADTAGGRFTLDAGTGCLVQGTSSARDCLISGVAKTYNADGSVQASYDLGPSKHLEVGFEPSDAVKPFVFCHISEHRELFQIAGVTAYGSASNGGSSGSGSYMEFFSAAEAEEAEFELLDTPAHLRPRIVVENVSAALHKVEFDLSGMIVPGKKVIERVTF